MFTLGLLGCGTRSMVRILPTTTAPLCSPVSCFTHRRGTGVFHVRESAASVRPSPVGCPSSASTPTQGMGSGAVGVSGVALAVMEVSSSLVMSLKLSPFFLAPTMMHLQLMVRCRGADGSLGYRILNPPTVKVSVAGTVCPSASRWAGRVLSSWCATHFFQDSPCSWIRRAVARCRFWLIVSIAVERMRARYSSRVSR